MVSELEKAKCHGCGRECRVPTSADPHRIVLCARCREEQEAEGEDSVDDGEPLLRHSLASDVERFESTKRRKT